MMRMNVGFILIIREDAEDEGLGAGLRDWGLRIGDCRLANGIQALIKTERERFQLRVNRYLHRYVKM